MLLEGSEVSHKAAEGTNGSGRVAASLGGQSAVLAPSWQMDQEHNTNRNLILFLFFFC